jgi:Siphovirus ReqiPepy6 Gp37-like protein
MIFPNARYEIFVCDSRGNIIAPFNIVDFNLFIELSVTRTVNEIGACYIRLSGGSNAISVLTFLARYNMLQKDTILAIYRTAGSQKSLLLDTVWFVRTIEQSRESTGSFVLKITAYDTNYLLASRIILNSSGSFYSEYISTVMTQLVKTNIGSSASVRQMTNFSESNDLSEYGYKISHYSSDGVSYGYANLHSTLQELSNLTLQPTDVGEILYPIYFDTIAVNTNSFIFQLFPNQRGTDRRYTVGSSKGLLISDTFGQMQNVRFVSDWQDEKTSVTAVYKDNTSTQKVTIQDARRIANSPYSVREMYFSSQNDKIVANANSILRDPSVYPQFTVYATLQDIPSFLFGVDWNYGDYITINAFGTQVDTRIHGISITVTNKTEQIDVSMQVSESISF